MKKTVYEIYSQIKEYISVTQNTTSHLRRSFIFKKMSHNKVLSKHENKKIRKKVSKDKGWSESQTKINGVIVCVRCTSKYLLDLPIQSQSH